LVNRRLAWILVLLLALALIGYSVYRRVRSAGASTEQAAIVPVIVALPHRGEIERTLGYSGTLEPQALVTVTSKIEGRIERILVGEGDTVQAGQILVRMEDDTVVLQLEQANSAVGAAQAQLDKARRGVRPEELENARALLKQAEEDFATGQQSYQRTERLYDEGALAKAGLEEAEQKLRDAQTRLENARRNVRMMEQGASPEEQRLAEANLKAAEAQARLAGLQLDFTRIRSPLTGRVAKVLIDEGNMASRATPLLVLVQEDPMLLRIPVPERHYQDFSTGRSTITARVRLDALPDLGQLAGGITAISPTVDPASRTFMVETRLENREGRLKAGMYADVQFVLERRSEALLVPASALVERGGRPGVFIVDALSQPSARFRQIVPGIRAQEEVEVLQGLSDGERIVVEGNAFLEEGQRVTARER
jgi:multidrug efflux pump subunit AcrA (membrane-fusion protein)